MDIFIIDAPNQPGELAKVSQVLGEKGINIETVGGIGSGDRGMFGIISNNDAATRAALDEAGIGYHTVSCVTVNLPHQPGELAKLTKRLADAGVNLEFVAPTGLGNTTTIALGVADADSVHAVLSSN
jgi:hypothetical protein